MQRTENIIVRKSVKLFAAKHGPNKLFGEDIDVREKFSDIDAMHRFNNVWDRTLERLVIYSDKCSSNDASSRLTSSQKSFFDLSQEHRSFRVQSMNLEFIVQLLSTKDGNYEMTQFWRIISSDSQPKTLFVNFATLEERINFRKLAANLGAKDEELALGLVMDFMSKYPEKYLRSSSEKHSKPIKVLPKAGSVSVLKLPEPAPQYEDIPF